MTAPHFHSTSEAKAAIKKIEHNAGEGTSGPPSGIMGGSSSNQTTMTPGVTGKEKGSDWVGGKGK